MTEVNLIGGFYQSKTLPFSAQDVVNWLPVPAKVEGARSPMKLRGLPGLKSLNEEVRVELRILGDSPNGTVGTAYSFTYTAEGGTPPYTFSFVSGTLPSGLSFSAGTISGTPTTQETDNYRVRVTDSLGLTTEKDDSIQISLQPPVQVESIGAGASVLTNWNTSAGDTFSAVNTPARTFAYWGLNETASPDLGNQQYRLLVNGVDRLITPVFPSGSNFPRVYYKVNVNPGDVISCVSLLPAVRVGFIANGNA